MIQIHNNNKTFQRAYKSSHICNKQSAIWVYFAYTCMSNVVQYRDTKRFIIKLRMNICKINAFNQITINSIINCLHFWLIESPPKRGFPGQMKQQAASPKVKQRNRRTPAWRMKLYHCFMCLILHILEDIVSLIKDQSN